MRVLHSKYINHEAFVRGAQDYNYIHCTCVMNFFVRITSFGYQFLLVEDFNKVYNNVFTVTPSNCEIYCDRSCLELCDVKKHHRAENHYLTGMNEP